MTIDQALNKALEAYGVGNIRVAKKIFGSIIKIEPNNSDANHNMGLLLIKSDELEESLPFFKTALEANFSAAQYWFIYIDALFNVGRFTQASELLATAKNKGCKGPAFDGLVTKLSSKEVELEIRIQRLQKLNEVGPYAYLAPFEIGNALKEQGKLVEAIEAYNKAIALKPDYAEAYNNMGITLADQGKLEEAIEAYTKAIALKPDYAAAYNNMAVTFADQGKLEEAIEAYTKALSLKPDNAEAYSNMGVTLQDQGKLEEAIEAYNKALVLKPDYVEAYNNLGNSFREQSKLEEAIEAYNKALALKPDNAKAYSSMGVTLADQGKLVEAIEAYNKALALKPNNADVENNMGIALADQGKLDEAVESYNKALALNPDYAEAYFNMGNALKDQGKLDEAIEAYNKALAIKHNYPEAYNNMGVTLKDQCKLEEAVEAYNKALTLKPDNAEAYNNMGIALADQGKLEEAIEAYTKALSLKPDYAYATENFHSLAVQLLPSIPKYGYEFYNRDTKINPKIVPSPKYQIQNAIEAFLKADFRKTYLHNNNFKACDPNLLDKLLPNAKVFCNAYSIFLGKLLETNWDKAPVSEIENKAYHLGESHCLSYAHQSIKIDGSDFRIAPRITFGAKAFHFSRIKDDSFKAITKANFISLPKCSKVFISFGEIDCRPNEGFITAARKLDKPLEDLIYDTVVGYVQWFFEQNEGQNHFLYFINVPAPLYEKAHSAELNSEVARTVALFNAALKKYSLQHSFDLVDVFKFTSGNDGFSNGLFHVDSCHLGAKAIPKIEQQLT